MWITLFAVVLAVALGLGIGAVVLESSRKEKRRFVRKRIARGRSRISARA
jgi:hypothetical protein